MSGVSVGASAQTLRSYEEFARSLRCFDNWLTGVVPGAMDLDCVVERRGQILIFELKAWKGTGVAVSYGSHLCLSHLAGLDGFSVYLVGEERTASGVQLHLLRYEEGDPHVGRHQGRMEAWFGEGQFADTSIGDLRSLVRDWWAAASG